jgi:hypothetical protein
VDPDRTLEALERDFFEVLKSEALPDAELANHVRYEALFRQRMRTKARSELNRRPEEIARVGRRHRSPFAKAARVCGIRARGGASIGNDAKLQDVRVGSKADLTAPKCDFRYSPESRLISDIAACPKRADIVAKVFFWMANEKF